MPAAFVTGATGFLGLNLIAALRDRGWEVTALHRPSSSLKYLGPLGARLRVGNVEDYDSLRTAMPEGLDAVFHTAASLSWWRRRAAEQYRTNVLGTRNVARAALERSARRLVHTSSIAAFGLHDGPITEETPSTAADSPAGYVRTKYLAEVEVRQATRQGLSAVILNPGNIIGPYDAHNWGRSFRLVNERKLPGVPPGGGVFCHVTRVVEAHLASVERGRVGENYLLGGVNASYLEMFRVIGQLLGKPVPKKPLPNWLLALTSRVMVLPSLITGREPDITPDMVAGLALTVATTSDKATRELGYDANQTLENMLGDCHRWLVAEGLLAR